MKRKTINISREFCHFVTVRFGSFGMTVLLQSGVIEELSRDFIDGDETYTHRVCEIIVETFKSQDGDI